MNKVKKGKRNKFIEVKDGDGNLLAVHEVNSCKYFLELEPIAYFKKVIEALNNLKQNE